MTTSRDEHFRSIAGHALRALALCGATLALLPAAAGAAVLKADFNGDGYEDLVVGSPYEDVGSRADAGAVSVFYGKSGGLPAEPDLQWHQDTPGVGGAPGIAGVAETGDLFAYAAAVGDFDRDGFDDLAVGVPGEALPVGEEAGAVNVLYGSAFGLQLRRNHVITLGGSALAGAAFGAALSAGDYNGDGYDDLAAGAPAFPAFEAPAAGAVSVFHGGPRGLGGTGYVVLGHQHKPGDGHNYGTSLATADFDRDGFDDLAVGIPDMQVGAVREAGGVEVLYGSPTTFTGNGPQRSHLLLDQGSGTSAQASDYFGAALTAADFNCDAYPDLAIGHPGQDVGNADSAGAVTIVYGGRFGASGGIRDYWPASRLPGKPERIDYLGASLAGGDFNGDGCGDLAIGVAHEDQERLLRDRSDVGHVIVLDGSVSGMRVSPGAEWHQDRSGVGTGRAKGDQFGWAMTVGDFNRDDMPDLAVGVPGEKIRLSATGARASAGIVQLFYGTPQGLTTNETRGRQTLGEAKAGGRPSLVEKGDRFGWALP